MIISFGWWLMVGGVLGAIRVLRARTFSWRNEVDCVVTDQDRAANGSMTPVRRWILVGICVVIIVTGVVVVQMQHNWNVLNGL
jgi:hypothetical protein